MSAANNRQPTQSAPVDAPRADLRQIARLVRRGARVLDLGCGSGELMQLLIDTRQASVTGVEIEEENVLAGISRGLTIYHADLDEGLGDYQDQTFDYVILSQTLQAVHRPVPLLREIVRVGKEGIISFPNFGYWKVRWSLLRRGRMPKTEELPYEWYDTPNIHLATVRDFEDLCRAERLCIDHAIYITGEGRVHFMPNLRAETALFVVRRQA